MTPDDRDELLSDLYSRVRGAAQPAGSTGGTLASAALATAFKTGRGKRLKRDERAQLVETLFQLLQNYRWLEFALQLGVSEESAFEAGADEARAILRTWRLLRQEITVEQALAESPERDWKAVANAKKVLDKIPDPVQRFGLAHSFPDFLAARLLDEYGAEAEALVGALAQRAPLVLRANTLKVTREQLLEALKKEELRARPSKLAPHALILKEHLNIFELPAFELGLIEQQDEASQLVAELVAPPPNGTVIDACAGAGGKTLALAALMKNKGRLLALDIHEQRLEELRKRARRAGAHNIQTLALPVLGRKPKTSAGEKDADAAQNLDALHTSAAEPQDAREPRAPSPEDPIEDTPDATEGADFLPIEAHDWLGKAERVLVDAPCSGLGALRRKPEPRIRLDEAALERLPRTQFALAKRALEFLKPGGRLIYSTCTILRAENEAIIEQLLQLGGLELVLPKEILGRGRVEGLTDASGRYLKLLPHQTNTDGFFAAVLRKKK